MQKNSTCQSTCVGYFSPCCDKMPYKKHLKRWGFRESHSSRGYSQSWQESMPAGVCGSCSTASEVLSRVNRKWCKTLKPQDPPPVIHFLQQDSIFEWSQIFPPAGGSNIQCMSFNPMFLIQIATSLQQATHIESNMQMQGHLQLFALILLTFHECDQIT